MTKGYTLKVDSSVSNISIAPTQLYHILISNLRNLFFYHSRNTMAQKTNTCSLRELMKTSCHELHYTRSCGLKQLVNFGKDTQTVYLWQAGLLDHHGEKVLGNVFEWHATKYCSILNIHRRKTQGSKRIIVDMVQQLKAKKFDVQRGHMLCHQCITAYENIINASSSETEVEEIPMDELMSLLWMMQLTKCKLACLQ